MATYDEAGNLNGLRSNDGSTVWRYTYDGRNRLVKVQKDTGSGYAIVARYLYDGLNRRVKKDVESGTDVVYVYDGWQVLEEREEDGADNWEARRQFIYGGRYIDEPLIFDIDTTGDGNCTDAASGDDRYLYAQNANYNIMALTDNEGGRDRLPRKSALTRPDPSGTLCDDGLVAGKRVDEQRRDPTGR